MLHLLMLNLRTTGKNKPWQGDLDKQAHRRKTKLVEYVNQDLKDFHLIFKFLIEFCLKE